MKYKKSAIDLTELAIGIIVLGIVVSVGATIMINFRDSRLTSTPIITTHNETSTQINGTTGAILENGWVNGVTRLTNATGAGHATIPASNYSVSIDSGGTATITSVASGGISNLTANVTYDWYNTSDVQWTLPNQTAVGLGEYGNWFTILVIVGIAAVVLSLIFLAFGRGKEGSGVNF